jgi:hypothetical protein
LVLISAHYGNFELGGYLMGLFGFLRRKDEKAIPEQTRLGIQLLKNYK